MSTATCLFFLKGSCRKGKECNLSHRNPKSAKFSTAVCPYFLQNNCAYGDKCKRSHTNPSSAPQSGASSTSESKEPRWDWDSPAKDSIDEQDQADLTSDWGKNGASATGWGATQKEEQIPTKSPCIFFSQSKCKKGDECLFAHITPNGSAKTSVPSKKKSESKICKHYAQGSCQLGDGCRLKHIDPVHKSSNVAGSESSASDWSSNGPATGIAASNGPEADDQHFSFANGDTNTNGKMRQQDTGHDVPDDIYGEPNEDNGGKDGDEDEDDGPLKGTRDFNNHDGNNNDEYEENDEADTTLKEIKRKPSFSGYAGPRSTKENGRRGSWYGAGWDEPTLANASAPSPVNLPSQTPKFHRPSAPQPVQTVIPTQAPSFVPHWSQFADPQANAQIPFCKAHAQAQCAQGAACRFRHFLTPEEYTLLFHDPQPNMWTFDPNAYVASLQQAVAPPSIPIASPVGIDDNVTSNPLSQTTTHTSIFTQECKFYRLGTCRNADRCPYAHTQHPVVPDPTLTSANTDQEWGNPFSRTHHGKLDSPCKFFVEKGSCNRGKDCKYRHDISTDRLEESSRKGSDNNNGDNAKKEDEGDVPWDPDAAVDSGWGAPFVNAESWENSNDSLNDTSGWGPTASTSQTEKKVCSQFSQGTCSWGNNCRFSHDVEPNKQSGGNDWPPEDSPDAPWNVQSVNSDFQQSGPIFNKCNTDDDDDNEPQEYQSHNDPPKVEGEEHWTKAWGIEDQHAPVAPSGSVNKRCKMFVQGYCRAGEDCSFMHTVDSDSEHSGPVVTEEADSAERAVSSTDDVDKEAYDNRILNDSAHREDSCDVQELGPEPESQLEPIIFDHPMVSRFWEQCTVVYGEDITPSIVTTFSDSNKLVLSNLPIDVTPEDITRLASPYGQVTQTISLEETVDSAIIQIEFTEAPQAYEAFKHLDGREYESKMITATLKGTRTVPVKRSVGQKIYAKVSWPKPYKRAWSHYPTIGKAKQQAIDLNNVIIRGRAINASFVSPKKNQKSAFAVLLQNLDPETTRSELEAVCTQYELITVDTPVYSEDVTDEVKALFDQKIEHFDMLPATNGTTSTAFVTFKTEAMAAEVTNKLQSHPLPFLGKQCLTIREVHYTRYCIPKAQFKAIKSEIDNVKERIDGSAKCTIQYDDHRNGKQVWVRIHAALDSATQFVDTNYELRSILQGIVVMFEGKEIWDEYFEISSSANAMEQIQSRTNTLIKCDLRCKRIRIFGSKAGQTQAQTLITKALSKVRDRRNEIDLPRYKLYPLVNWELKTLQNDIGVNKVSLDVIRSKLVLFGSSDEVAKANETISLLNDGPSTASSSRNTCQICHHSAVNPVLLSCHHAYCNTCLQFAIRQIRSAPFRCISLCNPRDGESEQCSAHVPYIILHDILSAEEDYVLRASFYAYVRSRTDELFFCPSLDCPAVHRVQDEGVNIKCKLCASELCAHCKSLAHIGMHCPART